MEFNKKNLNHQYSSVKFTKRNGKYYIVFDDTELLEISKEYLNPLVPIFDPPIDNININVVSGSDNAISLEFINSGTMEVATLQDAIDLLPKNLSKDYYTLVRLGSGTFDGANIKGFYGGGQIDSIYPAGLYILGTYIQTRVTTGVVSGTAGAGTSSTQLTKPSAAAGWTNGELRRRFLKILSGSGSSGVDFLPTIRPIKSNTTSSLFFDSIPNLNETAQFEIVECATVVKRDQNSPLSSTVCLSFHNNYAPIVIAGIHPDESLYDYGFFSKGNSNIEYYGCYLSRSTNAGVIKSENDIDVKVKNCFLTASSKVIVDGALNVNVQNIVATIGSVNILNSQTVTCNIDSDKGNTNSLFIKRALNVSVQANIISGSQSAIKLESINYFEPMGLGITGGSNSGYGIEISKSGHYDLTGVSLTGSSGSILLENQHQSYVELAQLSASTIFGTTLVVQS